MLGCFRTKLDEVLPPTTDETTDSAADAAAGAESSVPTPVPTPAPTSCPTTSTCINNNTLTDITYCLDCNWDAPDTWVTQTLTDTENKLCVAQHPYDPAGQNQVCLSDLGSAESLTTEGAHWVQPDIPSPCEYEKEDVATGSNVTLTYCDKISCDRHPEAIILKEHVVNKTLTWSQGGRDHSVMMSYLTLKVCKTRIRDEADCEAGSKLSGRETKCGSKNHMYYCEITKWAGCNSTSDTSVTGVDCSMNTQIGKTCEQVGAGSSIKAAMYPTASIA